MARDIPQRFSGPVPVFHERRPPELATPGGYPTPLAASPPPHALDPPAPPYPPNRNLLLAAFAAGGIDVAPAEGAFYVWADVGHLGDSRDLCRTWLDELAVAATPGVDFDPSRGHRFVRCSVAGPADEVDRAATRLTAWFAATGDPR